MNAVPTQLRGGLTEVYGMVWRPLDKCSYLKRVQGKHTLNTDGCMNDYDPNTTPDPAKMP